MTTRFIPYECLEQVFINLSHHNKSTLFNCLLVNRSWCRQVVPILWSRPFSRLQWKPSSQLIQTYISCMTSEKLPNTDLETILPNLSSSSSSPSSQPLFNYAKYLRKLNLHELSIYVNIWYTTNQSKENNNNNLIKIDLITQEIGKFIIYHSNKIHEICLSKVYVFSNITNITTFPGATNSLSHIQKIKITGANYMETIDINNLSEILIGLSKICTKIREIEVYKFRESHYNLLKGLITLIKAQQGLSKFIISCWNLNFNPLIPSLQSQIHSLKEIEFTKIRFNNSFIFKLLSSCNHLNKISFQYCDGFLLENVEPIIKSPPASLKKLYLCDNDISSDILITLLRNTRNTLNHLTIDERMTNTSTKIIETIVTHCPNLTFLDIKVLYADDILNLLYPLRKSKLKHLILNNVSSKDFCDNKKFSEMGKFLPNTLQNLGLIYWDFNLQSLKTFLENCDCPLKKLFLYRDNGLNDDHLDIITQYAKCKGTLKYLSFLFRSRGHNSIPSIEAVKKAQQVIPMIHGK
ncbi:hypothetical protein RclHR1_06440004 [Rhizophagus clarus]|uniref:Uncharacterized protein n=1 Tax=Rhizophagus clarus TaxID=94130 RepID=A0A2Z6SIK3_9GLOM|nr:hypothetical protein RclHR1_06440004 [Rhizophagus clarus]GES81594.1 hypothetical protein GLOIN_2v1818400 [Rhizophagus clarus]